MRSEISLNGKDWRLLGLMPDEAEWRKVWERTPDLSTWDPPVDGEWILAEVPGDVQSALLEARLIPNPYRELNSYLCEWSWNRDWIYLKEFVVPEYLKGMRAILHFDGVDYSCRVYLNRAYLGEHEGTFTPFEFDASQHLNYGELNRLWVVVGKAPDEQWQIGRTSKVRTWKPRFAYGWDWCTRLVPLGIWKGVRLIFHDGCRLLDVWVRSGLSSDTAHLSVRTEIESAEKCLLTLHIEILSEEGIVARSEQEVLVGRGGNICTTHLKVESPKLWHPNGYGEQAMYRARVSLRRDGEELDRRDVRFGIREVRAVPNEEAPPDALPYTLEVNGRRVFIKGWNWTPLDHLYGNMTRERYERFLRLAKEANVNMLRVWGGGLIEREPFYELCDELGIMIWQEFIQSSSGIDNEPSSDEGYLRYIDAQAREIIPLRRNHPSLVIWCGGNELMDSNHNPLTFDHPAIATLKRAVEDLDPDRIFLPTSPSGPLFGADPARKGKMHDVHGHWRYLGPERHYEFFNSIDPLLHSEFGVEGAANEETMLDIAPLERLWPPKRTNRIWTHHGSWWINWEVICSLFGEPKDLKEFIKASQFIQAEGLRYGIEANRRRKWRCSGTIPWQFNEAYPNTSCTNCVDFYGRPKPAYWWVRKAYEPIHVSASYPTLSWHGKERFRAEIWGSNSLQARTCRLETIICDLDGEIFHREFTEIDLPENSSSKLSSVEMDMPVGFKRLFILQLKLMDGEEILSENCYLFSAAHEPIFSPLMHAPSCSLSVERRDGYLEVFNEGPACAIFVWITPDPPDSHLGNNYLILIPGESRRIPCNARSARISAWNAEEKRLEG
jgi:beta-mannosidase